MNKNYNYILHKFLFLFFSLILTMFMVNHVTLISKTNVSHNLIKNKISLAETDPITLSDTQILTNDEAFEHNTENDIQIDYNNINDTENDIQIDYNNLNDSETETMDSNSVADSLSNMTSTDESISDTVVSEKNSEESYSDTDLLYTIKSNSEFSFDTNRDTNDSINELLTTSKLQSTSNSSLSSLFNTNSSTIHIPAGEYDGKGQSITLDHSVTIYGDGSDKTILKNISFITTKSITVKDLSISNAASINTWTHDGINSNTHTFFYIFRPSNYITIDYQNCNFSNADYVSFVNGYSTLKYDSATNCTFKNIKRIAIYHAISSHSSTYKNNTFQNIGDKTFNTGMISAIWLGDIQNITSAQSTSVLIDGNTMSNLYTADDPNLSRHVINANFIAIRAAHATISNNDIKNLYGYGEDREGIYTKVKYLDITHNTISNAGFGEGYICCKAQEGLDAFTNITGNTISGNQGSAIHLYGPGAIKSNTINMTNCEGAIICLPRDSLDTRKTLTVASNIIDCTPGYYYLNNKKMTNHFSSYLIHIDSSQYETIFRANDITCNNTNSIIKGIVRIGNIANNISATYNKITSTVPSCIALMANSNTDFYNLNKNCVITISNNIISSMDYSIQVIMTNAKNGTSNRSYILNDNKIYGPSSLKYGIYISGGNNNNDILTYATKQPNTFSSNQVYAICNKISTPSSLVTLAK